MKFKLHSKYQPTGDQPQAIEALTTAVKNGDKNNVLLGVTGSGKTFTMANVIEKTQKPTLVIAHNKTLAAQLYQELRDFFPNNAVSYFVSYYDYYQPEAYIPSSDTYIEKEATINEEIDKLRLATTTHLMTRKDVIVVASVSCIYSLGAPVSYESFVLELVEGELISRESLVVQLANLQYERSETDLRRGTYRVRGDIIQIWPAYQDTAVRIDTLENKILKIEHIDPISGMMIPQKENPYYKNKMIVIYPAKHYVVDPDKQKNAFTQIRKDLKNRVEELQKAGKIIEAHRLEQKVNYDLEMIQEFGSVNGIENYSPYFENRNPGEAPYTLLDYFKFNQEKFNLDSFLTIVDESHMTIPQIRGMYFGDRSRKETLIEYGFRLPRAIDNRPLQFQEFMDRNQQLVYVSATPNEWEIKKSQGKIVEQLIRPTGLLDPKFEIRPSENQIQNLVQEIIDRKAKKERVLVTTLTKKMAEALTDYLNDEEKISKLLKKGQAYPKVAYLHSDIDTLDRSDILDDLRKGEYDVLVGINLLREGLDLPEVSLVTILDADKEGFLRSATALIQTMGRAARHQNGEVILYADKITKSMQIAMDETNRRRQIQEQYNLDNNIIPQGINKPIREKLLKREKEEDKKIDKKGSIFLQINQRERLDLAQIDAEELTPDDKQKLSKKLKTQMKKAAKDLDYELAALIRDKIQELSN